MNNTSAIDDERCNSPYHFDLEKLSGYGADELKSVMEDILEALLYKQYQHGYYSALEQIKEKVQSAPPDGRSI